MEVICPACKTDLEGDIKVGDEVECPDCHHKFNVANTDISQTTVLKTAKPKKKLSKWGLVAVFLIGLAILGQCVNSNKEKTATTPTAPIKTQKQIEDDKRNADNTRIIADSNKAQANARASNNPPVSANNAVSSSGEDMDFDKCLSIQKNMENTISPNYKTLHLVSTSTMSVVRFCTNDGSVLSTCSANDRKSVIVKSDNMEGCK